jgi:hypothetical protein
MLPAVMVLLAFGAALLLSGSPTAQAQTIGYSPSPCAGIQSVSPDQGPAGKLWVVKDCNIYSCTLDKKGDQYTCAKQTHKFNFE